MTVSSTANPSLVGQPVQFIATVTGPTPPTGTATTPSGTVQFAIAGTNAASPVTLVGGVAALTAIATLAPGSYQVTANYGGNADYLPASTGLTQQVNPDLTLTTLSSSDGRTGVVGSPVVYTVTVTVPPPGAGIPTGTVVFSSNGVPIPGCGAQPLSGSTPDTASCLTTHQLPVGTATVTATYEGATGFAPSTSASSSETTTASQTITGNHLGSISVAAGKSVVIGPGADQTGSITVDPGGYLDVETAVVHGAISANNAAGLRMCVSTVNGPISITGSTGLVVSGDDEGSPACAGNTIKGPVSILNGRGGVEFDNNTVTGAVTITGNTGSVPAPDTGSVVAVGNTISGAKGHPVACSRRGAAWGPSPPPKQAAPIMRLVSQWRRY
ncbi:MAG: Ig-like domain-containing protein [Actinomycetota bacterium]